MVNQIPHDYLPPGTRLTAIPTPPAPVRVAGDWWRMRVRYQLRSPINGHPIGLPPPPEPRGDRSIIYTGTWLSSSEFRLESLSGREDGKTHIYPYVYVVGKWLQMLSGDLDVVVDGVRDHPMLRMITFSESYLEMLRTGGYLGESR